MKNSRHLAKIYTLATVILITSLAIIMSGERGSNPNCAQLPAESSARSIVSLDRTANEQCFFLEKATNGAQRQLGLSGRELLQADRGMLFVFDKSARQCMWMKDMKFDLDMIWLDENERITQMKYAVTPETYPESFCGEGKYVVEVNAGVARRAGLGVGDTVKL